MAENSRVTSHVGQNMWTEVDIDVLLDELKVPAFWLTENDITYGLLNSILRRLNDLGKPFNQISLHNILKTLKPFSSLHNVPQYYNLVRKLKSKTVDFTEKVTWFDSVSLGPACESLEITITKLQEETYQYSGVITNTVVLELREHWRKTESRFKLLCNWLYKVGVNNNVTEDQLRYHVNSTQLKHSELIKHHKKVLAEELLDRPFAISHVRKHADTAREDHNEIADTQIPCNSCKMLQQQLFSMKLELSSVKQQLSLSKKKTRTVRKNFKRREKRRNLTINKHLATTNRLSSQLASLNNTLQEARHSLKLYRLKARYHMSKTKDTIKKTTCLETKIKLTEKRLQMKENDIIHISEERESKLQDRLEIDTMQAGVYSNEVRQTIMALGSLGLGSKHIIKAIKTVATGLFGTSIANLPSETTVKKIQMEGNLVGKVQISETLLSSQNATLHVDGTTDHQRHFFAYQVGTGSRTFALGVTETVKGDTDTQLIELQRMVTDFSTLMTTDRNEQSLLTNMLMAIKNLMTDQHVVNRKFKEDFEHLRLNLIDHSESNWSSFSIEQKQKTVKIHQWFCFLHVLLGLTDATEEALSEYEAILTDSGKIPLGRSKFNPDSRRDNSAVAEVVKATCALLTPGGHPSAGISADFKSWMDGQNKKILFVKYKHNRFNVTFHNASALYYHMKDVKLFLCESCHRNQLVDAVSGDVNDDILMACVRGVAIMHVLITAPFHARVLSEKTAHILELNPYLEKLRLALEEISSNPWSILEEDFFLLEENLSKKNELFTSVMPSAENEQYLEITMEVLSLVATHCLVTFCRQVASHLPGGEHSEASEQVWRQSHSVPTSNSIGESQFAYLKFLRNIKPNANVENLEGSVMWAYNGTLDWLQSLSFENREKILNLARNRRDEYKQKWDERRKALRHDRRKKLQEKEQKEEIKVAKQAVSRQKTLDDVALGGGQCRSVHDVENLVQQYTADSKPLLNALKSQVRYYKNVINPPGVEKTKLQFSYQGKPYTCKELMENLQDVIRQYQDFLNVQPSTSSAPPMPVPSVRKKKIMERKKQVLSNYQTMDPASSTTALKKGLKRKGDFPLNLTGKRIRHRWKVPGRKSSKWYKGTVVGPSPEDAQPTEESDEDDNLATRNVFRLFKVVYDGDDDIYHLRIEKDWYRKDLDFDDED